LVLSDDNKDKKRYILFDINNILDELARHVLKINLAISFLKLAASPLS